MKICPEHDKPFSDKSPNNAGKYWHVIDYDKNEFCSKTKEEYDAIPDDNENPAGLKELTKEVDWDKIARGKVLHGLVVATIEHDGLIPLTSDIKEMINDWADFIFNEGKQWKHL